MLPVIYKWFPSSQSPKLRVQEAAGLLHQFVVDRVLIPSNHEVLARGSRISIDNFRKHDCVRDLDQSIPQFKILRFVYP